MNWLYYWIFFFKKLIGHLDLKCTLIVVNFSISEPWFFFPFSDKGVVNENISSFGKSFKGHGHGFTEAQHVIMKILSSLAVFQNIPKETQFNSVTSLLYTNCRNRDWIS